ncbi:hypothetical protein Tco_1437873 [Tanacetum coccineum]
MMSKGAIYRGEPLDEFGEVAWPMSCCHVLDVDWGGCMTDLQPDVSQLMVPVYHKQDRVVIGSQSLSVALDICRGRVEKMERNLIERLPFLKDVFVSIDDPLSAEALIEPPAEVPATNVLSTVVIAPHTDPSVSVEDYDNPDSAGVVPENTTLGSESGGGLTFSHLDDEARDAVL